MKRLYFIGGPMGVGKTTIGLALKNRLPHSVYLDGDWCWNPDVAHITDETKKMVIDNICHMLNNYLLCSIYEHVIFCWVLHQQTIIDEIINRISAHACDLINISLIADEITLKNRLLKDIENGFRTEDVIKRSLNRIPMYYHLNTIKVDTCNKTINEIVDEIIKIR